MMSIHINNPLSEAKMKTIRVERYGGPEVLELKEAPFNAMPAPGQAIVRVVIAGVNFMDVGHRRGTYPHEVPFTPGAEGSGVVESVGEGVTCVKASDRVAFASQQGAYAEFIVVDASRLIPLPDDFTFEQGAAFPLQGLTAQYMIHEFRKITPGESVLVHAAAGGVGHLLIQWAQHLGATVIGTVSSNEKAQMVRRLGVEHVIVYTEQDFAVETKRITSGRGVDLILDSVGKSTCRGNLDTVAVRGHIVYFGASSGPPEPIGVYPLMQRSISICGGSLAQLRTREELLSRANDVIVGIRQNWLHLNIGGVMPLEQAFEAHRLLENRTSQGKLLLSVTV
jgi:NADPH2:quinone reductase